MNREIEELVSEKDIVFDGTFWIDKNGVKHRYVDPMSDPGFKVVFGTEGNEELLIGLLNSMLPGVDIVELRYKNTEHMGASIDDGKSIFDVYCEDSSGVSYLVEMQNWSQRYFNKRAVYYSTYAIQDQARHEKKHQLHTLQKDEWDYNFAPVYVVCFLNFNMRKQFTNLEKVKEDEYLSLYRYRDIETGEELGDGTTLVFVEMKKFKKRMDECATQREMILCAMKNMSKQLEDPEKIAKNPLLKKFYHTAELAAMPSEARLTYIGRIMTRNDMLNSIAEQIEDARLEGALTQALQDAKEMLADDMPIEKISKYTKLSVEQIEALKA